MQSALYIHYNDERRRYNALPELVMTNTMSYGETSPKEVPGEKLLLLWQVIVALQSMFILC